MTALRFEKINFRKERNLKNPQRLIRQTQKAKIESDLHGNMKNWSEMNQSSRIAKQYVALLRERRESNKLNGPKVNLLP